MTNALGRARKLAGIVRRRARTAARSVLDEGPLRPGLCNICGSNKGFVYSTEHEPRENFFCKSCRSTSRDRMMIYTLGLCLGETGPLPDWNGRKEVTLLETSGYRAHPYWLERKFTYVNLIYSGVTDGPFVFGDVSRLGVRDGSVDVIISSDVFEHVRDDAAGFAEVSRALRTGGHFVLQAPRLGEAERTEVRVEIRGDEDVHVMPPEYHAEHTLVYRYYGNDLAERLTSAGMAAMLLTAGFPAHAVSRQTVLIGQKSPYVNVGSRPAPPA